MAASYRRSNGPVLHLSLSSSQSSSSVPFSTTSRKPITSTIIPASQKRTCMCSPTTHPGSFRCSLHKDYYYCYYYYCSNRSNRLNARRSAMTNSLVRIETAEGDVVKRGALALASSFIRPSSHQQRRRGEFKAGPSRLSMMSKADHI